MRTGRAALASLAFAMLLLAGCASKRATAPRPAPFQLPSERAPVSAARYMEVAASSALYAIRSSEMAASRARNPRLRSFAASSIRDNQGISGQLAFSGRRVNLLPSPVPTPLHQSMLDELARGGDFDSTYRRQQRTVVGQAYALHRDYARRGTSPTLRQVATMAEPMLARELAELR